MTQIKTAFWILMIAAILGCESNHEEKAVNSTNELQNQGDVEGVSIELSMPYGDSLRLFGICWQENPVEIIVRNQSDSVVNFYQSWNSWGFYNFSFQIETNDSIYHIKRTRNVWFKNFPSFHSINPNESLVFHFNLIDSTCFNPEDKITISRGLQRWNGLPNKEYESAKIKVMYELPIEDRFIINKRFEGLGSRLENKSDSIVQKVDTVDIFHRTLESKSLNIKIKK